MSAFKIKVQTDNTGTSNDDQFTIPGKAGVTNNYTVSGDFTGSPLTITDTNDHTITFPGGAGEYELSFTEEVSGGMPTIYFNNVKDCQKVTELSQWGTNKWLSFERSFYGCSNMVITATDHGTADTSSVTSMYFSFFGAGITSFPLINTSNVTTFENAFRNSQLASIALLDMSSCTTLRVAFYGTPLTIIPLFNTSLVNNWYAAFYNCTSLVNVPVLNMSSMDNGDLCFYGCTLNTQSYTDILKYLAANNLNTSVLFHGGSSKYFTVAVDDRAVLTSTRSWTIIDGGVDASSSSVSSSSSLSSYSSTSISSSSISSVSSSSSESSLSNSSESSISSSSNSSESNSSESSFSSESSLSSTSESSSSSSLSTEVLPIITHIENEMKDLIDNMSVANGYKLNWAPIDYDDRALEDTSYDSYAYIYWVRELNLDDQGGVWSQAYHNKCEYAIEVRTPLEVASANPNFDIRKRLHLALSDIKKLFGTNYNLSDTHCDKIMYQSGELLEKISGDIFLPKYLKITVVVYYSQDRQNIFNTCA